MHKIYYYSRDTTKMCNSYTRARIPILTLHHNNDVWFRALDITKNVLKYKNPSSAILSNVPPQNTKKLSDFNIPIFKYSNCNPHSIFINTSGLKILLSKSQKLEAINFAKKIGLEVFQKITRIEIDIVRELDIFMERLNIKSITQFQPKNSKYRIDYYLPDHKLAIEIDEHGHKNRNLDYELKREKSLRELLGCEFIRCNPNAPDFLIVDLVARICEHIYLRDKNK